MLDFLKKQVDAKAEAEAAARVRYDVLLRNAGQADLPAAEAAELLKLGEQLGIAVETINADASALRRAAELQAIIADAPRLNAESGAARRALVDYDDETERQLKALNDRRRADRKPLVDAEAAASAATGKADNAQSELASLRKSHWQLLGYENPALIGNRLHLANPPAERPKYAAPYPVIEIGNWLQHYQEYGGKVEWAKMPEQSEEEFDYLVDLASRAASLSRNRVAFLRFDADQFAPCNVNHGRIENYTVEKFIEERHDPSEWWFVLRPAGNGKPGQTPEQLDACIAAAIEGYSKLQKAANPQYVYSDHRERRSVSEAWTARRKALNASRCGESGTSDRNSDKQVSTSGVLGDGADRETVSGGGRLPSGRYPFPVRPPR